MAVYTSIWQRMGNTEILKTGFLTQLVFSGRTQKSANNILDLRKVAKDARIGSFATKDGAPKMLTPFTPESHLVTVPTQLDGDRVITSDVNSLRGLESLNSEDAARIKEAEAEKALIFTLAQSAERRLEKMSAEAIFTGKIDLEGSGIDINFNMNPKLRVDVGATDSNKYWTNATAESILQTIEGTIEEMIDSGVVPIAIVSGSEGIRYIKKALKGDLDNRRILDGLFDYKLLREWSASRIGIWRDIDIFQYSGIYQVMNAAGTAYDTKKMVPEDTIAIIGKSSANGKFIGANPEHLTSLVEKYGGRYARSMDGIEFVKYLDNGDPKIKRALTATPILADTSSIATIKFKA